MKKSPFKRRATENSAFDAKISPIQNSPDIYQNSKQLCPPQSYL
ncbi:hypothetical protein [Sporomusa sp. KB1]|jgi:hypothetical protein|nr:hypothetical protein [Sporomusa sp. KB1]